ncbi:px domain-containing protein [Ophiostoma piceae UAMH 11346]|uniref:Px domain-containing protein n=1 Tax=Ophiostoma piceae (strain UAMH 11346) TaxID=1262450 RepID=S3CFA2_OPHP1|nr:px domain-containing protein [Ophiostoma piceae UAMH 11346]
MPPRRSGGRRPRQATPRTPRGSAISAPGTPSSGLGSKGQCVNGQWMCDCVPRRQAVLRETQKGQNKGRWFYRCPQDRRRQCKFFMWEDYARVAGGAGPVGAAGPSTVPRSTYRTSIGQRTTPPAEQIGGPGRASAPATAPRPASMQQPLPPPPRMAQSAGRQRIFTTALHGVQQDDTVMNDGDDSSEDEEAPPTPTPVRTRRVSTHSAPRSTRSTTTRAATRAAAEPGPEDAEPASPAEPVGNQITKYFGIVKKKQPLTAKEEKQGHSSSSEQGNATSSQEQPSSSAPTTDDIESEADSEIDRGMMALVCESELSHKRKLSDASSDTARDNKKEDGPSHNGTDMESDGGVGRARGIVVPVRTPTHSAVRNTNSARSTRSGSSRRPHGLLVASEEYAAKEAAARGLSAKGTEAAEAATEIGTGLDPESSFAALFSERSSQPPSAIQQSLPTFSFSSSAMAPSQASTVALSQVPDLTRSFETVATTPSTSFYTDAGDNIGSAADSAKKRKRTGRDREARWYDNAGASSDDDGQVTGVVSEDPFMTPSKRVRFRDAAKAPSEDDEPGQDKGKGKAVVRHGHAHHRDHNVTRAVLQLLEGQQVETRVLQQVRALLNISFEDHNS